MAHNQNQTDSLEAIDAAPPSADISLGIFTVVAMILLLWGFCWLKSYSSLRIPQMINVIFSEVAGLNENAAVYVDGVRVGMVDKMQWKGEHRVLVRLRINTSHITIPIGSKFEILTNGIVGAKYVQIDMPHMEPGKPAPAPIDARSEVAGEDPVRPELAVNKLAISLGNVDLDKMGRNFEVDRARMVRVTDQLGELAEKTMPLLDRAGPFTDNLNGLTTDMRTTSRKLAKFMDDPHFSSNLKETAQLAREAAGSLDSTMKELHSTLSDKPLRNDLLQSFHQLNESTLNIEKSLAAVQQVAEDKQLRADLKDIVHDAHATLNKVDEITSKPIGGNFRDTLNKTNDAITHLDLAAKQINQILAERNPLLHLLVGRPGFIKVTKAERKKPADASESPSTSAP